MSIGHDLFVDPMTCFFFEQLGFAELGVASLKVWTNLYPIGFP